MEVEVSTMFPSGMLAISASARPLARTENASPGLATVPLEHSTDMGAPPRHGARDECAATRSAPCSWTRMEYSAWCTAATRVSVIWLEPEHAESEVSVIHSGRSCSAASRAASSTSRSILFRVAGATAFATVGRCCSHWVPHSESGYWWTAKAMGSVFEAPAAAFHQSAEYAAGATMRRVDTLP